MISFVKKEGEEEEEEKEEKKKRNIHENMYRGEEKKSEKINSIKLRLLNAIFFLEHDIVPQA